jgi:hypothetical protein
MQVRVLQCSWLCTEMSWDRSEELFHAITINACNSLKKWALMAIDSTQKAAMSTQNLISAHPR